MALTCALTGAYTHSPGAWGQPPTHRPPPGPGTAFGRWTFFFPVLRTPLWHYGAMSGGSQLALRSGDAPRPQWSAMAELHPPAAPPPPLPGLGALRAVGLPAPLPPPHHPGAEPWPRDPAPCRIREQRKCRRWLSHVSARCLLCTSREWEPQGPELLESAFLSDTCARAACRQKRLVP